MQKQCRLADVENFMEGMELTEVPDDVVDLEDGYQMVLSGWHVHIPELRLRLHEGVVGYWDEKMKEYMPDFCVTVIYPEEPNEKEYLYYEQDGMLTTMINWLHGQMDMYEIEQLVCEIVVPESSM